MQHLKALLSEVLPESTTYPVMTTSPLNLPLHTAWVPESHATNLYNASYLSVILTMKIFLQLTFHHLPTQYQHRIQWFFHRSYIPKCTLTTHDDLDDEEEEDFQTVSLEDDHWTTKEIPDRYLCIREHSVPHELCPYPCPYMDYISSSYYNTLDLSDISEFEDLMTTSSDEDIPALDEDIGY